MNKLPTLIPAVLILLLSACNGGSEPGPSPTAALPTAPPAATNTPAASPEPTAEPTPQIGVFGHALHFLGAGDEGAGHVKVTIDPPTPADIGATDITFEFWMKANPGENLSPDCQEGADNWHTGNLILDRDVAGPGDFGDFGLSLANDRVAFGVHNGEEGAGVCSQTIVSDGVWHHIAATRHFSTGDIRLFVDGFLEAEAPGPRGDLTYRDGRPTDFPDAEPFLFIGAGKDALEPGRLAFRGWLDEIHLSKNLRYAADFERPILPFEPDEFTSALWHLNEGMGEIAVDSSLPGDSPGTIIFFGPDPAPEWVISDLEISEPDN
jgi:hypothetical protein